MAGRSGLSGPRGMRGSSRPLDDLSRTRIWPLQPPLRGQTFARLSPSKPRVNFPHRQTEVGSWMRMRSTEGDSLFGVAMPCTVLTTEPRAARCAGLRRPKNGRRGPRTSARFPRPLPMAMLAAGRISRSVLLSRAESLANRPFHGGPRLGHLRPRFYDAGKHNAFN